MSISNHSPLHLFFYQAADAGSGAATATATPVLQPATPVKDDVDIAGEILNSQIIQGERPQQGERGLYSRVHLDNQGMTKFTEPFEIFGVTVSNVNELAIATFAHLKDLAAIPGAPTRWINVEFKMGRSTIAGRMISMSTPGVINCAVNEKMAIKSIYLGSAPQERANAGQVNQPSMPTEAKVPQPIAPPKQSLISI